MPPKQSRRSTELELPQAAPYLRRSAAAKPSVNFVRATELLDAISDEDLEKVLSSSHLAVDLFGRIVGVSDDVAGLLGYSTPRLVGRRLGHRVSGVDRLSFQQAMLHFRATREPFALRVSLRLKHAGVCRVTVSLAAQTLKVLVLKVESKEASSTPFGVETRPPSATDELPARANQT